MKQTSFQNNFKKLRLRLYSLGFTCLTLCLCTTQSIAQDSKQSNAKFYEWILEQAAIDNELNTNQLVWSDEFQTFLGNNLKSNKTFYLGMTEKDKKANYTYHLSTVLGGPPDKVQFTSYRTIMISACRPSSCPEKGFVWIDLDDEKIIFGILAYFYEDEYFSDGLLILHAPNFTSTENVSKNFEKDLFNWLSSKNIAPKKIIATN